MKKEQFSNIIKELKNADQKCSGAFNIGIDTINFTDNYHSVIQELLRSIFGLEKTETLYWYLYEYQEGKMKIYDNKTSEVLYDFDKEGDLWKYMNDKGEPLF
jgi:glutamine cyclotransferase